MVKKKILVVDDEASITRLLKLNLEKTGAYVVRTENEGTKTVEVAREFKPDLILLDVMMPDIDGGDVAAHLQADGLLRSVPIVFLTAAVKKEELDTKGGMIGGFAYIAK
ncbi:MAG TPA: response regulator, partial [Candidatus Binatia bacterium]|nr:response regulator [Candidatus Binatia bacterium]